MRRCWRINVVASLLAGGLAVSSPVLANELLAPVIASLPDIPLVVGGQLLKRDDRGRVEKNIR